jgi:hypothetical protein
LEIQEQNLKELIKTKAESHKIEPNPSKDQAIHGGNNPLFLDIKREERIKRIMN